MLLPKKPDGDILELLARAKAFQDHAIRLGKTQAPMDQMIAIHNLDNSIEYLLRIIVRHLDIEEKTGKAIDSVELAQMAGDVNRYLKETFQVELPYLKEIKLLRQVRNLVQHAMVNPQSDLPKFITISQRFFERVLKNVFDLSPSEVRTSSLVLDHHIKTLLIQAEEHMEGGRYLEAVVKCRNAFEDARFKKFKNSMLTSLSNPTVLETQKDFEYLTWYIKQLTSEFEVIKLGVEARIYKRFMDYVGHIPLQYSEDRRPNHVMQREWTKDDAQFCYMFVAECAYKWEVTELEPLYIPTLEDGMDGLIWREYLDSVELTLDEPGALYASDSGFIRLLYVDSTKRAEILEKIREGNTYTYRRTSYLDGNKQDDSASEETIRSINTELVTNDPVRWRVLLWTESANQVVT